VRAAVLGALTLGAGTLLAACEQPAGDAPAGGQDQAQAPAAEEGVSCDSPEALADLSEAQLQTRTANNYVEESPEADQQCNNCGLWQDPAAGEDCGGCTVVQGPINPEGWCSIWVPAS
jgi:hypothetical protein